MRTQFLSVRERVVVNNSYTELGSIRTCIERDFRDR